MWCGKAHTNIKTHTQAHIQYTHDVKDLLSDIAQCHFPVHYILDGAVRREMNDISMCVCLCSCDPVTLHEMRERIFSVAYSCLHVWIVTM